MYIKLIYERAAFANQAGTTRNSPEDGAARAVAEAVGRRSIARSLLHTQVDPGVSTCRLREDFPGDRLVA